MAEATSQLLSKDANALGFKAGQVHKITPFQLRLTFCRVRHSPNHCMGWPRYTLASAYIRLVLATVTAARKESSITMGQSRAWTVAAAYAFAYVQSCVAVRGLLKQHLPSDSSMRNVPVRMSFCEPKAKKKSWPGPVQEALCYL